MRRQFDRWSLFIIAIVAGACACAVLCGCHTVEGVGLDLQRMAQPYTE